MRRSKASPFLFPCLLLMVLGVCVFSLSCVLDSQASSVFSHQGSSILTQLLGSSRIAISEELYDMADLYFHKGVPHAGKRAFTDLYQRWAATLQPTLHRHSQGKEVEDILPWLAMTTALNPHHVEAFLVAAYWLAHESGRADVALQILRRGRHLNPRAIPLYIDEALLEMRLQHPEKAARTLDAGLTIWPGSYDEESAEALLDLTKLLGMRAFLYLLDDQPEEAIVLLEQELTLRPDNISLRERIEKIKKGAIDQAWAQQTWEQLYVQPTRGTSGCTSRGTLEELHPDQEKSL